MGRLAVLPLVAAFAACSSHEEPAAHPSPLSTEGLETREVPAQLGAFRWVNVYRFPDPSLGVVYSFGDDTELRPDVYLYPRSTASPATPEALREEGGQLVSILPVQQEAGRFDAFEVLGDSLVTVRLPAGTLQGSHVSLRLTRQGEPRESHQHIFAVGDEWLKIRSSFPPSRETAFRLDGFIEDLLEAVIELPE